MSAGWDGGQHVLRSPASLAAALQAVVADKQSDPDHASALQPLQVNEQAAWQHAAAHEQSVSGSDMDHAAAFLHAIGCGGVAVCMQRAGARASRKAGRAEHQPVNSDVNPTQQQDHQAPLDLHPILRQNQQQQQQQQQQADTPPLAMSTCAGQFQRPRQAAADLRGSCEQGQQQLSGASAASLDAENGASLAAGADVQQAVVAVTAPANGSQLQQQQSIASSAMDVAALPAVGAAMGPDVQMAEAVSQLASASGRFTQIGNEPAFCLVKLRCCGKGRVCPGAAVHIPHTQDAQSASRVVQFAASLPSRTLESQLGKDINSAQEQLLGTQVHCNDPHEITLSEEFPETFSSLPASPSAAVCVASASHHAPSKQVGDDQPGAEAMTFDDQTPGSRSDLKSAQAASRERLQHQQKPVQGLADLIGYVTSCTPEGVTSHAAMAICSLQGLYSGWIEQNGSRDRPLLRRHASLQLCVQNVRGGIPVSCKPLAVLN